MVGAACLGSRQFKRHLDNHRTVQIGSLDQSQKAQPNYAANKVSTTKYTWYSFLPKGLYEQFRRVANIYFAFHAMLTLTPVTPVNPVTTIIPLVFIIGIAIVREGIEDVRRGRSDKEVNNRLVPVFQLDKKFKEIPWKEVRVGNIVRANCDDFFPADMLFLSSNDSAGICYVETMNLDGESNLKLRKCLEETRQLSHNDFKNLNVTVEYEQPNPSIYTFVGNFIWGTNVSHVGPQHVLLRGSKLRNTPFIYGAVLFTGPETKIMMNATDPPSKRSTVERQLDWIIFFQLGLLISMSMISAIIFAIFLSRDLHKQWYLQPGRNSGSNSITFAQFNDKRAFVAAVLQFFTSLVLYGYFVPISLYVSMEIVKVIQAFFVNWDIHLYYEHTDKPASARTSNLNEELGQVNTILSDKTGTLTRNEMEFVKCSIAGVSYGAVMSPADGIAAASCQTKPYCKNQQTHSSNVNHEKGFSLKDPRLDDLNWQNEAGCHSIHRFLEILALCHTVVVVGEPNPDTIKYLSESPDEAAFVVAAKRLGVFLYKRSETSIYLKLFSKDGSEKDLGYELLNILEFDSIRRRMSVVLRDPEGCLLLFCKGADTVIFERLSPDGQEFKTMTRKHINDYGEAGLRTLAVAYRVLDEKYYADWQKRWLAVKEDIMVADLQAQRLNDLAEEIECDLILVGATAIEDKLQVGVEQAISKIAAAGIKIWILTGDKMETAINIGYACNLLRDRMVKHIIRLEENNYILAEAAKQGKNHDELCSEFVSSQIEEGKTALNSEERRNEASHAIIIDGKSLAFVLKSDQLKQGFLALALRCDSVICCRASPKQKANVTEVVRNFGKQICLAIGDGANDVGMIRKANIGVGIAGVEGQQAVMAADFAIAQFRFLERLLLVHGSWFYNRIAFMINYFFYKNFVFGFSVFLFNSYSQFSGQSVYADWYLSLYNVVFTAGPVIVVAILDQDLDARSRLMFPPLYMKGQQNAYFRPNRIALWMINGVIQAAICFFSVITAYDKYTDRRNGKIVGLYMIGTTMYTCILFIVNIQIAIIIQYWTWLHHFFIWGELILWFVFLLVSGELPVRLAGQLRSLFIGIVARAPTFYVIILITVILALIPNLAIYSFSRTFFPDDYQIVQELEKLHIGAKVKPRDSSRNSDTCYELELVSTRREDMEQKTVAVATSLGNCPETWESQAQPLWKSDKKNSSKGVPVSGGFTEGFRDLEIIEGLSNGFLEDVKS